MNENWCTDRTLAGIREDLHSNLDKDAVCTNCSAPLFPSATPGKFWDSVGITSRPLPFKSFSIHFSSYHSRPQSQATDSVEKQIANK
jgi:hypothetical protein